MCIETQALHDLSIAHMLGKKANIRRSRVRNSVGAGLKGRLGHRAIVEGLYQMLSRALDVVGCTMKRWSFFPLAVEKPRTLSSVRI
jgi:hypothetical protein